MTETVLYAFTTTGTNGFDPNSLALAPTGVLYGTTQWGGASQGGTVFELAPPASPGGDWTETTLYDLEYAGGFLYGQRLAAAPDGTVYGAALGGTNDVGMVFAITP